MKVQPYGLVKDVLIEIWGSSTLVDFLVVDMDPRQQTPAIYGAPFLKSVKGKGNHQHEGWRKTQKVHLSPQKTSILLSSLSSPSEGFNKVEYVEVKPYEPECPK
jgi:hypothetical protein